VTNTPSLGGNNYGVTWTNTATSTFFRLRQ
jgi:hypothetical protein